ncbi:hypothetical protein PMAYCL1PPCAC_20054, partial [Pristionchus mayeri]
CIVCHRLCSLPELLPFTSDQHKRTRWVNSVRWTPEGRRSLIALLSVTECPYLCASHFLPSDFNHDSSHNDVRPDAVPLFVVSNGVYNLTLSNAIKKELVEIKDEPIDEFAEIKQETKLYEKALHDIETSNENKASPVKDEPIDAFADVKLEEPIADMYCPSTGSSRLFDHSTSMEKSCSYASENSHLCSECGRKLSC